ncbi:MAG: putative RND superfamily exporter protein [Planctomycetota bacterium]|jgi:predicted RND superfamily exporter protein
MVLALVFALFGQGIKTAGSFGDVTNGSASQPPTVFDPRMDIWFDESDPAVDIFYEIEERFVSEDFVMVTFEETENAWSVFNLEALATICRLSERFLTIPGVRHVRSLTDNPWIR